MRLPTSTPRRLLRWLPLLLVLLVLVPAFLGSDNLHARVESTSFDRLMLGLRWLNPVPHRWDPNFPLGTALLMAVPHALGLDPVLWGRLLSLGAAGVAAVLLFALVRRAAGEAAGAVAAAAIWLIPAVTRGAVVTGEEAPYLALLLAGLLALVRAASGGWRWLLLSALAANATVLLRLDAMTVVPLFGLLGVWLLGVRRGALLGVLSLGTTLLHMAVSWRMSGDPIGFARVASFNIQRNADGFDVLGPGLLPLNLVGELGWAVLGIAGFGGVWLWKAATPAARALGAAWVWLFVVDLGLTMVGAMEARTMRYLVPLLVLTTAVAAVGATRDGMPRPERWPWLRWMLPVGLALSLLSNVPEIRRQTREERLPDGLADAARWLGAHDEGRPAVVGEEHPTFVVLGGLDHVTTGVLPPGSPDDNRATVVRETVDGAGATWLVEVSSNPPRDAIEAAFPGASEAYRTACCTVWRVR